MSENIIEYHGSCHCGSVKFSFNSTEIKEGLKCNCSICLKKNGTMSIDAFSPDELKLEITNDALATYEFGSGVAKHHFCKHCGIYPFHQTKRQPGYYRVNLNCVDSVNTNELVLSVFDGASLEF